MNANMTVTEAWLRFKKLPEEQQEFISSLILTAMDACEELRHVDNSIPINVFPEAMAYKRFKMEVIAHTMNHEFYNSETDKWEVYDEWK